MAWNRAGSAAATAGVLAAALALPGCALPGGSTLEFSDTERAKITEVRIAPGSGDVTVRTSAIAQTRIRGVVRYRYTEPGLTYRLEGTVLHLATDCGDQCNVSYDIEAPAGVAVRGELGSGNARLTAVAAVEIRLGSGDITVDGASAAVTARTGSGDVTANDVAGPLSVTTGSGDVRGRGLGGGQIGVQTRSGDVSLTLDRAAAVNARTSSGDVTLQVPDGRYRVVGTSGSGDRTVDVTEDPDAATIFDINTGSGDVLVSGR